MKKTNDEQTIESILKYNFQYLVDIDYYRNSSHCECHGICRCSTIENAKVEDVDLLAISDTFSEVFSKDEFTRYCVNRIVVACKLYDPEMWDISIRRGYYGEEVRGVYLSSTDEIENWLGKLKNCKTNQGKIFTALECEYGYILDDIKNIKNWEIIDVTRSSLNVANKEHYRRLEKGVIKKYSDYKLPRAVCVKNGDSFRLIDGYHRLAATKNDTVKIVFGY